MCGIVGAYFSHPRESFPILRMTSALRHRGPDDEGYVLIDPVNGVYDQRRGPDTRQELRLPSIETAWSHPTQIVFGHRRLAVIDLSVNAHQPMSDREGRFWIIGNGEIYNYTELREELAGEGAVFRSDSDTEVILEAYKKWGEDCLHHFNGMWAFALWHSDKRILFAARDRFGVKPFYYAQSGGDFFFASEIKALLEVPGMSREIEEESVFDFLAFSQLPSGPNTFFGGIHALDAGSLLTVGVDREVRIKRWYELKIKTDLIPYDLEQAEAFQNRLMDSVSIRMRSDVPVGSCLSGGLDSSSIVTLATESGRREFETFSACYEDRRYDERPYIQCLIEDGKCGSHFVFPRGAEFWKEWPELVFHQEEPFGSSSIYAQWCVMREARRSKIPVLLDGQGGDELLGGYLRYRMNRAAEMLLKRESGGAVLALKNPLALGILASVFVPPLYEVITNFGIMNSQKYLRYKFLEKYASRWYDYVRMRGGAQSDLNRTLHGDFFKYSLPVLLRYEDKNAMRFSIETRLPFLDYRLVEWMFELQSAAKIACDGSTKRILRDGMQGLLPEKIRLRHDKIGFGTPEAEWLHQGRPAILNLLRESPPAFVASWVDVKRLRRAIERGAGWDRFLWRVVNLEMWCQTFLGEQSPIRHENSDHQSILSS